MALGHRQCSARLARVGGRRAPRVLQLPQHRRQLGAEDKAAAAQGHARAGEEDGGRQVLHDPEVRGRQVRGEGGPLGVSRGHEVRKQLLEGEGRVVLALLQEPEAPGLSRDVVAGGGGGEWRAGLLLKGGGGGLGGLGGGF